MTQKNTFLVSTNYGTNWRDGKIAEMTPLVSYLAGFAVIQLAISLTAFAATKYTFKIASQPALNLRFAGFLITGAGVAFLSSAILG